MRASLRSRNWWLMRVIFKAVSSRSYKPRRRKRTGAMASEELQIRGSERRCEVEVGGRCESSSKSVVEVIVRGKCKLRVPRVGGAQGRVSQEGARGSERCLRERFKSKDPSVVTKFEVEGPCVSSSELCCGGPSSPDRWLQQQRRVPPVGPCAHAISYRRAWSSCMEE